MAQKFYCYVDESGQDTQGTFFLVASVIIDGLILETIESSLKKVEIITRKGQRKWQGLSLNKKIGVRYGRVRGLTHRSSSFIRLADALAGFTRDYLEKAPYAKDLYEKLMKIRALKEI